MEPGKPGDTAGADETEGPDDLTFDGAFAELRPAMFALAYRITGNRADAEEIVQDAFVRLHDAAPLDAVRSLKAYRRGSA
jgi:RNA polymerase sigma-70 factor (ECF subfamily)